MAAIACHESKKHLHREKVREGRREGGERGGEEGRGGKREERGERGGEGRRGTMTEEREATTVLLTHSLCECGQLFRLCPAEDEEAIEESGEEEDVRDEEGCEDVPLTANLVECLVI